MFMILFGRASPGQRKQQIALWCLFCTVGVIIAGMCLLPDPDLVSLAVLAGAPTAAVQGIHAAGNVAEHKAQNGGPSD